MKLATCRGVLACGVLTFCLLYWIGYSRLLCGIAALFRIESHLESISHKLCPRDQEPVPNVGPVPEVWDYEPQLVAKLHMYEENIRRASVAGRPCRSPESLSQTQLRNPAHVSCQKLDPAPEACMLIPGNSHTCPGKHQQICQLKISSLLPTVPDVLCGDVCTTSPQLGVFNQTIGQITWSTISTMVKLQARILRLVNPLVAEDAAGFCMIRCDTNNGKENLTQLLVLPPNLSYLHNAKGQGQDKISQREGQTDVNQNKIGKINFNMIILEGVCRNQFWSQLPDTIKILKSIQNPMSELKVFDFEMVQDLDDMMELVEVTDAKLVEENSVFKTASSLGYETLWLEDKCSMGKLKRNSSTFDVNKALLQNSAIGDIGLDMAFCDIELHQNLSARCSNGLSFSNYTSQYLRYYQAVLGKYKMPYISAFKPYLGNRHEGLAALDESLMHLLEFSSRQENTITFVMTLHGSSDLESPDMILNGNLKVFQPTIIMIMPKSVQKLVEKDFLQNLIENQKKLVSTKDVYDSIKYIMHGDSISNGKTQKSQKSAGIFGLIHSSRNCSEFDLEKASNPSCICANHELPMPKDNYIPIMAEFAVSQLNTLLQRTYDVAAIYMREIDQTQHVVASCRRLVGVDVFNITKSLAQHNKVVTKMLIQVMSQPDVPATTNRSNLTQTPAITPTAVFEVVISHSIAMDPASASYDFKLKTYRRLGEYQAHATCTGGLISTDLCVCDPKKDHIPPHPWNETIYSRIENTPQFYALHRIAFKYFDSFNNVFIPYQQFDVKTTVHNLDPNDKDECLFVVFRTYDVGGNFEAVNVCSDRGYLLGFSVRGDDMRYSSSLSVTHRLMPLSVQHLVTVFRHEKHGQWSWKYQVEFIRKMFHF